MIITLLLAGTVVIPPHATRVERFAADELAEGLGRVTGEAYAVVDKEPESGLRYLVGGDPLQEAPWKTDEIRLVRTGDRIVLTGDPTRGPIYAVNEYLERFAGVRWWTKSESDYPRRPGFLPPKELDIRYAPPFAYRETLYLDTLSDARFKVRMKCNVTSQTRYVLPPAEEDFVPPEMGGNHRLVFFKGRRSSYHSFFEVLPPDKWFKVHPEWYALDAKTGERLVKRGQLCVTDEAMAAEYIHETLRLLRENPECDSIQVSQNDVYGYCECPKCSARAEAEGSWSGPYLEFANKVAEAVEKEFANVMVDTFAYQFTSKAPKTVRPRKNVLVRLCSNECFFNRPLADSPAEWDKNASFMSNLGDWSRVADGRLYIWDYQANFTSYMLPHPNLHVFADNIRTFRKFGAVGVFEQGDALCPVGDFAALKQYVTAHLLWNPDLDWRDLRDEFLSGYYGSEVGKHIAKVLEIAEASATRPGVPGMRCYHKNVTDWISVEAAQAALAEIDAAQAAARQAGEPYVRRVRAVRMSWDHARILNWERWAQTGDRAEAIREWKRGIKDFGVNAYCETTTRQALEDYLLKLGE